MRVILRKDAKEKGLKRYFTGKPCKHGHIAERLTRNADCIECSVLRAAEWCIKNKERVVAAKEAWCARNKERKVFLDAVWYASNPDKAAEYKRRRRARKLGIPGSHTAAEVKALLAQQDYRCANPRCNADLHVIKRHLDHKNPLSRPETNPTNSIDNLQWLCQPCNDSKGNKTHEEFAQYRKQMKCETV